MNNDQQGLLYLLRATLHKEELKQNKIVGLDWKQVFELAKEQQIYTLLFPIVKDIATNSNEDNDIINDWKKVTILSSILQKQNITRIVYILNKLKQAEVEVIALKGLVLREYYPLNELRIMSDYDLLMHTKDLDKTKEILIKMGYIEDHRDSKHIVFRHDNYLPIEIHWLLTDPNHFKDGKYLEENIWKNTERVNLFGAEVLIPSVENQMLHLFLHLVVHYIYSGFGIRQLVDIYMLIEQKGNEIDWTSFDQKLKECNIQRFAVIIFEICRRLLGMKVPEIFTDKKLESDNNIDLVIYSIFFGGAHEGVFGKSLSFGPIDEKLLGHHDNLQKTNNFFGNFKYFITIIFPKTKVLKNNYPYANRLPILIPIAWVHRIFEGIFRKDFSIKEKKNLISSKSEILRNRDELLNWLEIK